MADGLLHIGSMAVLSGVVFLGLEKVESVRLTLKRELDELRRWLKEEMAKIEIRYDQLWGTTGASADVFPPFRNKKGWLILELADERKRRFTGMPGFAIFREWNAPFLPWFETGTHRPPIAWLTIVSIFLFIYLVVCSIAHADTPYLMIGKLDESVMMAWFAFGIFVLTFSLIIIFSLMAHRILEIRERVKPWLEAIRNDIAIIRGDVAQPRLAVVDQDASTFYDPNLDLE